MIGEYEIELLPLLNHLQRLRPRSAQRYLKPVGLKLPLQNDAVDEKIIHHQGGAQ